MEYFDGLVQERHNSSALAMELHLSCTNPLTRVAHYYMLVEESRKESFMTELQTYKGIEKVW